MKNIGRYQGTPCYECMKDELDDLLREGKGNDNNIYIANGVMVKKGIIIGYYDGQHVKENYDGIPYFIPKKDSDVFYSKKSQRNDETEAVGNNEAAATVSANVSYESLVKQDIDFNDYSKIVDRFFALLEENY